MSCLGRERLFEYAAHHYGAKVLLYRLNYAIDLRYGVLCDIGERILSGEPISLANPFSTACGRDTPMKWRCARCCWRIAPPCASM